jgi:magnesium chelatase accessory protein
VPEPPIWERDGLDWPNREASRFVQASGLRWHVQVMGSGPVLLLVHGTGAATHSWRDLAPKLARHFTVVAPDLPGHGFTAMPPEAGMSLPGMAEGLTALLRVLEVQPVLVAGHSAGAAILARMCLDGVINPQGLISLNGAFLPLAVQFFSPLAKLLSRVPVVPQVFAWHVADRKVVERLMNSTGSTLDGRGMDLYARLMRRPGHASAALAMMANWDLRPVQQDLPRLAPKFLLIVGGNDRTIRPDDARRVAALVPGATIEIMDGLGHLAHEERPAEVAEIMRGFASTLGV